MAIWVTLVMLLHMEVHPGPRPPTATNRGAVGVLGVVVAGAGARHGRVTSTSRRAVGSSTVMQLVSLGGTHTEKHRGTHSETRTETRRDALDVEKVREVAMAAGTSATAMLAASITAAAAAAAATAAAATAAAGETKEVAAAAAAAVSGRQATAARLWARRGWRGKKRRFRMRRRRLFCPCPVSWGQ